jgi:hypothetical protein
MQNDNLKNETPTDANNVLANVIYPELEDMRMACKMIANGIDDLTPMLSKEETEHFKRLASKWMFNLRKHKEDVINGMIEELSL